MSFRIQISRLRFFLATGIVILSITSGFLLISSPAALSSTNSAAGSHAPIIPSTGDRQPGSNGPSAAQQTSEIYLPLAVNGSASSPNTDLNAIYWGAYVSGSFYGFSDVPPWDERPIDVFESHTGKKMSILHWGQRWQKYGQELPFDASLMEKVRQRGELSLFDWTARDYDVNPEKDQPAFALSKIIAGSYDNYIRQWATAAKNWGHPFFLRFNHEMNGDWYPWSEQVNGNQPGQFVQAWRHVHDIFSQVGASNVTWVWCPNIEYQGTTPLEEMYPGSAYVDWTCIDGYNWGSEPNHGGNWQSFDQVFRQTYDHILKIAPDKPMMIGEVSSTEYGGPNDGALDKAQWIREALTQKLPLEYPAIKALVWFNVNADNMDWVIETSPGAQSAFKDGISSSYYLDDPGINLERSPIPPPGK